jgi:hypothetical protein
MKQQTLLVVVLGAVLVVNGIGFAVYKSRQSSAPAPVAAPAPRPVPAPAPAPDPAAVAAEERALAEQNARARRAAGIAALEAGDYDKALINFTEAQSLVGEAARVTDLLKITDDLRNRAREKKAEPESEPKPGGVAVAGRPAPAPAPAPGKPGKPVAARPVAAASAAERPPEARPTEAPAPLTTGTGMLLVSTTPRGLLVQIDGQAADLTPMRAPAKVGTHRVALFDGDRRVYETTIEVQEGQVATVLRDLSVELAPKVAVVETRTEVRPEPTPAPRAAEPKPAAPAPAAEPKPTPPPTPPPAPTSPVAVATGGLEISSPGLYGEIWVNGRPQGFPPLTVNSLAPGSVKIEVRVNGAVKRSTTTVVEAGQVKPVRVVR